MQQVDELWVDFDAIVEDVCHLGLAEADLFGKFVGGDVGAAEFCFDVVGGCHGARRFFPARSLT